MTQLRSSSFVGQAAEDCVKAVAEFGFTERQARFLVTVMLHSGACLLRQYTAFAGIVHGQKTRKFFHKLVSRGYAKAYPCRHNRGRVYHVQYKAERFMPGGAAHGSGNRNPRELAASVGIKRLGLNRGRGPRLWRLNGVGVH